MSIRYGARSRPGTMVSTWLNGLVSGTVPVFAGYFGGGKTSTQVTTVDRFLFSDDSRTTLSTGLSATTRSLGAMASDVAGYFGGGFNDDPADDEVTTVDRFLFSNDSRTTLGTGLSAATQALAGMASTVAGYFGGGDAFGATVNRFLFSDDSRTTLGTGLSASRSHLAGMASADAGYFGGGYSGPTTDVDRFLFSDDSRTTLGTGLSAGTGKLAAMAS